MPLQLSAGLDGDRAFFDHQPISRRTLGDGSRDSFDGGKVRITVRERRRSDTNEDRFSPRDCVFRGSELETASFASGLDYVLQVRLEDLPRPVLQFRELFEVALTAEYVVADLCQASSGSETYITRAND